MPVRITVLFKRCLLSVLAVTFLLTDLALAIPFVPVPAKNPTLSEASSFTIARRKRRRRKKPKAKPAPSAEEPALAPDPGVAPAPARRGLGGTTRIEFDAQLIKGQTTKAGEVQILERKDTALKSMVKRRTSFREEIIHSVFPEK